MNKITIIVIMLAMLTLTGCIRYNEGSAIGYVNAVDGGILWDKVWFKTSMESSMEDCYLLDNTKIKNQLNEVMGTNVRVKITYDRHLMTFSSGCGSDSTGDEIKNVEVLTQ